MQAPALVVALPLLVGVLWGAWNDPPSGLLYVALATTWIGTALALVRRTTWLFLPIVCGGFACAGAILGAEAARGAAHGSLLEWHARQSPEARVHLTGVLRTDATAGPTGVGMVLDVRQADGARVEGGVRLSVAGSLAAEAATAWRAGRPIAADVTLREPIDYADPGVASDRERLARQHVVLLGSVKSAALVSVLSHGSLLDEAAAALRMRVRTVVGEAVGRWSRASAGVVTAILIADRGALDPDDERRLQEAGTYHVIAISGGNIALLTALLVACGRAGRLPSRATAAASIALLAFYGYAAGLAPSVLRATLAGMIYLAGRALDHRGGALNAVGVAAGFAAAADPLAILDPGFVLSFGATFAIVIAAHRVSPVPVADRDRRRRSRWRTGVASAVHALQLLGAATLCAELALAPIGARLFGRISLAGLFLNFAAIPLMSIIQVAGLVAVMVATVSATAAAACGWIAHAGTAALLWSAGIVDLAPWLVLDVPPPAFSLVLAWYVGSAGLLFAPSRLWRGASAGLVAVTAVVMLASPPRLRAVQASPPPAGWTRVVFLDVGQGDATLVQPPDGDPLLIDAGGSAGTAFDLGRRVTLPAAWAFGVRRLGALVLTHGDPDHIGGAPPILRALSPRAIWDGVPVPSHQPLQRLREAAQRARIPWVARRTGESLTAGSLRIRVLNPAEPDWERRRVRNDDSVVLEIRMGDVAFLLPGDITAAVEPAIAGIVQRAPLTIVKAPHHGSAGSSSPGFVDAIHPNAVIFSAGRRNPFGHPAPVVVSRYQAAGARVFSTAEDGAVVMDTDGREVRVWTWRGNQRPSSLIPARADGSNRRH